MSPMPVIWRSLLYVPANRDKFIEKAHARGADGIILDLEDSVPVPDKPAARATLAGAAEQVARNGADVLVRINRPIRMTMADLEAAVIPGVSAFLVTKAANASHIRLLSEAVADLEAERGIAIGTIRFVAMIETADAFFLAREIAGADPRMAALSVGGEDIALSADMEPDPETLLYPKQYVQLAARAAGISPLGMIGTVADYRDVEATREAVLKSRRFGFDGASCVHPSIVPILNDAFTPSPEAVEKARRIVSAYRDAEAAQLGSIEFDGKMIDVPVAIRAQNLLDRAAAIATRGSRQTH